MKRRTQIARVDGKRMAITTSPTGRVTVAPAKMLEEDMQAAMVTALRKMPEYGKRFLFAGDMNAGRRGHKARQTAIKTGMMAGEPDMRIYGEGGRLLLIENKVGQAALEPSQADRHPKLAALGHPVTVLRAKTEDEAAALAVSTVRGWLADNDNHPTLTE